EQSALFDRGLVARDDELGLARIEDIGGREPGDVLAPPAEDRFGAAIGEQIAPVADALDDQGYRDVVDHKLQEFLGVFELTRQRAAVGDVVKQRDQKFRLVLLVARNHAVGSKNALLVAALDVELAAILPIGRLQRRTV